MTRMTVMERDFQLFRNKEMLRTSTVVMIRRTTVLVIRRKVVYGNTNHGAYSCSIKLGAQWPMGYHAGTYYVTQLCTQIIVTFEFV